MPDEFGPRVEADAYRVYLFMSDHPDECVCHVVLRVGDDASVSFAKDWLHDAQPQPLLAGTFFDAWRVEKFIRTGVYENIGEGLAERECRWARSSWKSLRARKDEKAGASEYRNGVWALDQEVTPKRGTRGSGLAKRRPGRKQRSSRALTPFQEKMRVLKEEAKQRVGEKPRESISETRRQWQQFLANARNNTRDSGMRR